MKRLKLIVLALFVSVGMFANNVAPIQSVTIESNTILKGNQKYNVLITEYENGKKEAFITSISVNDLRKISTRSNIATPVQNIAWDENAKADGYQVSFKNKNSIEKAFNNAFRLEEKQLGLAPNTLRKFALPVYFNDLEDAEQSFHVINAIRKAWDGVDVNGKVYEGMPLEGPEYLTSIYAGHTADDLDKSNTTVPSSDQITRLENEFGFESLDFTNKTENIAGFISSDKNNSVALPHVRAIYNWTFMDAGSNWTNRKMILTPSKTKTSRAGLTDNYGEKGTEGLVGLALKASTSFNPTNIDWAKNSTIVCLNILDPNQDTDRVAFQVKADLGYIALQSKASTRRTTTSFANAGIGIKKNKKKKEKEVNSLNVDPKTKSSTITKKQ